MSAAPVLDWWWLRHAPSMDAPPFCGWTDVAADLSDAERISAVRARLPKKARWLASDLRRAVETAEALGGGAALRRAPELREQHFGAWEGGAPVAAAADFWRDPARSRPPGGESFADLCARIGRVIAVETAAFDAGALGDRVVVAHAGVVRAALARALGLEPAAGLSISVAPLSITRLRWFGPPSADGLGGGWAVEAVNWTP